MRKCLVVLGMHRSGTSAVAGMLELLGADAGTSLIAADKEVNPKGFWEHEDVVAIHEQLLVSLGMAWNDARELPNQWWLSPEVETYRAQLLDVLKRDFEDSPLWLIKDPRMCRLLPLWHEVFREFQCKPLYVLMLRDPAEVAQSLKRRDRMWPEWSCLLWLMYVLEAEYMTRGSSRAYVHYNEVLTDSQRVVDELGHALAVKWPNASAESSCLIAEHISADLRRNKGEELLPDHPFCHMASKVFQQLLSHDIDATELDELRMRVYELSSIMAPWLMHHARFNREEQVLRSSITNLGLDNAALKGEIHRIKSTRSWRATAPFRAVWNLGRKLFVRN